MDVVLLTGASGFIAKHVALRLLNAGYNVRGTLRRLDRAAEVQAAVQPYLTESAGRLSLVQADLESDAGWAEAMSGAAALVHTASPFPIAQPKDPAVLLRPAVEGTERVLKAAAAAGVTRVVLTSSTVAVLNGSKPDTLHDEADWCDVHLPSTTPYARSKTLAERAAWEIARARGLKLTTINPGLVLGPPLDEHYGASLGLVERLLRGKDPMLPAMGFPVVDVRDVAEMHLRALQRPATEGRRYLAASGSMAFVDMGRTLKAAYPTRRIPTREAPNALVRFLALFDPEIRSILPRLGHLERVSNARAVSEMGMEFIAPKAALLAAADWLVRHGRVGA
ncbi:SDR family oxidoreductase [Rhodobacter calidifons]|uniref:Aldehyde reductase n=1 Tax=Rhodobacter calidifons TaxID=2715277 RepID=A0ABX0G5M3_9RHOB|nr:aldehyde reductase [Rhodobacter calidifons]NHB76173.1 aldehyde reductase [Rhodobacter calidifons]